MPDNFAFMHDALGVTWTEGDVVKRVQINPGPPSESLRLPDLAVELGSTNRNQLPYTIRQDFSVVDEKNQLLFQVPLYLHGWSRVVGCTTRERVAWAVRLSSSKDNVAALVVKFRKDYWLCSESVECSSID